MVAGRLVHEAVVAVQLGGAEADFRSDALDDPSIPNLASIASSTVTIERLIGMRPSSYGRRALSSFASGRGAADLTERRVDPGGPR